MQNDIAITLDIDWAPDYMIAHCLALLKQAGVKSTWFVTHDSPMLSVLKESVDTVELGLHPNFLPGSSHGESVTEVIRYVHALVPEAQSVRTHGVVQSGLILSELVRLTGVKMDATIFLPQMPFIQKVVHLTPHGELQRIGTYWADDYELLKPHRPWSINHLLDAQGIKVFNFHPIHIYLNTGSAGDYERFRQSGLNLRTATQDEIAPFINPDPGAGTCFKGLIEGMGVPGKLMKEFID